MTWTPLWPKLSRGWGALPPPALERFFLAAGKQEGKEADGDGRTAGWGRSHFLRRFPDSPPTPELAAPTAEPTRPSRPPWPTLREAPASSAPPRRARSPQPRLSDHRNFRLQSPPRTGLSVTWFIGPSVSGRGRGLELPQRETHLPGPAPFGKRMYGSVPPAPAPAPAWERKERRCVASAIVRAAARWEPRLRGGSWEPSNGHVRFCSRDTVIN